MPSTRNKPLIEGELHRGIEPEYTIEEVQMASLDGRVQTCLVFWNESGIGTVRAIFWNGIPGNYQSIADALNKAGVR